MRKKYIVQLTEEEREYLHKLISSGTAPARKLNRARVASCSRPTSANTPKERRSSIVRSPGCSRPPPPPYKGCANAFTREDSRLRWNAPCPIGSTSALWRGALKRT